MVIQRQWAYRSDTTRGLYKINIPYVEFIYIRVSYLFVHQMHQVNIYLSLY